MADDKEKKDEKEEGIQIGEATVKTVLNVSSFVKEPKPPNVYAPCPPSSFSLDTSMSTSMSPLPKKKQH
ncbi:unnamed protein product, partial [Mesorhabditis spiculigera]